MIRSRLIGSFFILALLFPLPILWIYLSSTFEYFESDIESRLLLMEVRNRDTELAKYLLTSRSHIENDFDKIASAQQAMFKTMRNFNAYSVNLDQTEANQAKKVSHLFNEKIEQLERFKTLHAKLTNSLRLLPKLSRIIQSKFNDNKVNQNYQIITLMGDVLTSTFTLRLFGESAVLANEYQRVDQLKQLIAFEQDQSLVTSIDTFIRHAELFLSLRIKEAKVVESLLANRLEQELSLLDQQLIKKHQQEFKATEQQRQFLIMYVVILFFIILLFILNRQRLLKKVTKHQLLSEKDQLTGLNNRRSFINQLDDSIKSARLAGHYGAIIFVDLDGFKAVNDNLGHLVGDQLLQKIAVRLTKQLYFDKNKIISHCTARLGGDEFVILLESKQCSDIKVLAEDIAEQALACCANDLGDKYSSLSLSASLGIAVYPSDSNDITELLHFADLAMYQSKRAGKNRWKFYSDEK